MKQNAKKKLTCFVFGVFLETEASFLDSSSLCAVHLPPCVLWLGEPLYTPSADELTAYFHCLGLNKVLKSSSNPVG